MDINSVSSSKAVKIIVHGWTDTGNTTWILNMTKAFLKTGDYSVIAVDWQNPANKLYPISAKNTKDVGEFRLQTLTMCIIDVYRIVVHD